MLDEIVDYCHQKYQSRANACANCSNKNCNQPTMNCEQCLKDIHFKSECHRSYDCPNMCYYYVCQNIHKYITEMTWIWHEFISNNTGKGKLFQELEICSIGCGPCTELVAFEEYCKKKQISIPFSFKGFDIEYTWNEIQNVVKNNSNNPNSVSFEHTDVFTYYNTHEKPNVLILNYVLSSIVKNAPNSIGGFINSISLLFQTMSPGVILINDINFYTARSCFDKIMEKAIQSCHNLNIQKYYFSNTIKACFPYGSCRKNSSLWLKPNNFIQLNYSTNTECHSAQMIIIKK